MRLAIVSVLLLASCGTIPTRYTMSTSATGPTVARGNDCEFRVVALPPDGGFEEIATLTPQEHSYKARTPEKFKAVVREQVCSIGGDVVVTEINGDGDYVRGTVLRAMHSSRAP